MDSANTTACSDSTLAEFRSSTGILACTSPMGELLCTALSLSIYGTMIVLSSIHPETSHYALHSLALVFPTLPFYSSIFGFDIALVRYLPRIQVYGRNDESCSLLWSGLVLGIVIAGILSLVDFLGSDIFAEESPAKIDVSFLRQSNEQFKGVWHGNFVASLGFKYADPIYSSADSSYHVCSTAFESRTFYFMPLAKDCSEVGQLWLNQIPLIPILNPEPQLKLQRVGLQLVIVPCTPVWLFD